MARELHWLSDPVEDLLDLSRGDRRSADAAIAAVRQLERGGRVDIKKLEGREGRWRIRARDFRVQFTRVGDLVVIVSLDNRRDAYDD